jgi:hypothetical protein
MLHNMQVSVIFMHPMLPALRIEVKNDASGYRRES